MLTIFVFLFGFLFGGVVVRMLMVSSEGHDEVHHHPARRAIMRHVQVRGTINLAQTQRMLSLDPTLCAQHLDQLEEDGLLKSHGHNHLVFYTRV